MATTPAPTTPQPKNTLEKILKKYNASRKYTESGFWDTWKNCWRLYSNKRTMIGYDGNVDIFVPETFTEIQGVKAHLVNGNLEVEFLPTHPDQIGNADTLQDLFNYAWYQDNMDQKLDQALTEYLITGNCYIFTYAGDDGLPCSRVVSARDAFFDPLTTNYQDLCKYGYAGYRYLTTKTDLAAEMTVNPEYDDTDPNSEARVPRYQNLDKLGQFKSDGSDKTAKQEREEMLSGTVLEDTEDQVECIVYFDKDSMITIGNRRVVLEEVDTPFQRPAKTVQSVDDQGNPVPFELPEIEPFIPVAPFRNLIDPNLWYAKGLVEVIAESQERLNDTQAQKADNLTYQLNRMWALDPNFAQKIDEIQSVPGAVFTIPPGALEQIPTQPIGSDADIDIARIKSEMQGATGSSEFMPSTLMSTGRRSAYMINEELVLLGARFKVMTSNLENEAMKILAQNMWKIMQIYIDKEIPIRVEGPQATTFATYNPGLYLGDWDVQIKLGATAETIKETARQQAMQLYLLASKLPFVNQQGLFQMIGEQVFDLTKRDLSNLILPPSPQQEPNIVPKLIETIQFGTDLYPDEQAEVLSEAGVNPSPMRQEVTGVPSPLGNPKSAALHSSIIHQGKGKGGSQAFEQAGMQTAGSPPVGAPTSGVANIPRVPNA